MDVVVVRWPAEADRREKLSRAGTPRVLLVEDGAEPPGPADCFEDWVCASASESEVRARREAVARRRSLHVPAAPELDADGLLRFGGRCVPLPPIEARLLRALLDRLGAVVSRDALAQFVWPGGAPGRNALDVHVLRLRRRLASLDLVIRTVRSRGYLLDASADDGDASRSSTPARSR